MWSAAAFVASTPEVGQVLLEHGVAELVDRAHLAQDAAAVRVFEEGQQFLRQLPCSSHVLIRKDREACQVVMLKRMAKPTSKNTMSLASVRPLRRNRGMDTKER